MNKIRIPHNEILHTKLYLLEQKRKGIIFFDRIAEIDLNEPFELYYWLKPPDNTPYQNAFPVRVDFFENHLNMKNHSQYLRKYFNLYYLGRNYVYPDEFFMKFKPYYSSQYIWYYRKS